MRPIGLSFSQLTSFCFGLTGLPHSRPDHIFERLHVPTALLRSMMSSTVNWFKLDATKLAVAAQSGLPSLPARRERPLPLLLLLSLLVWLIASAGTFCRFLA